MLYISYGSVCELETQILLAGDLDWIELHSEHIPRSWWSVAEIPFIGTAGLASESKNRQNSLTVTLYDWFWVQGSGF